ncbi:alpha/beta fold hydrolase [Aestuariicella hydrocarbonica]|uniref:Alpha/beta fold hydrolase n=1 Tax=Pseudomaricurvus hydrocarbonicus TaxID=1470433 RepID=A0A9E5MQ01_9GAMM|nr:alpha/beta fold hydrolase [Aestuariicella hydrocarbonica]NHO68291.1 alpha/beta fold hydrolase [Aestuariicella hydrocarbonica]
MSDLIYCRDENPESAGTPLILVHGLFGASENLMGIARAFDNRPVSLVDLRNHGRSFHADTMSQTEMAQDLIRLLDAKGWHKVDLLGHSLGGKVGLQLSQLAPERLNRLVVADIAPVDYQPHHQLILEGLDAVDTATVKSRAEADQVMSEYIEEPGVRSFLLMNLVRSPQGGYQWRCNLDALKKNYADIRCAPVFVQAFEGPCLYIRGGNSEYVQDTYQAAIDRFTPGAEIQTLTGCGHWLHAEKPADFNRTAKAFLS